MSLSWEVEENKSNGAVLVNVFLSLKLSNVVLLILNS